MPAFRPGPVTAAQLAELRRLATWPGLPQPESSDYVEQRIREGLDVNTAYDLIGIYGQRIRRMGPVAAMAEAKRRAS